MDYNNRNPLWDPPHNSQEQESEATEGTVSRKLDSSGLVNDQVTFSQGRNRLYWIFTPTVSQFAHLPNTARRVNARTWFLWDMYSQPLHLFELLHMLLHRTGIQSLNLLMTRWALSYCIPSTKTIKAPCLQCNVFSPILIVMPCCMNKLPQCLIRVNVFTAQQGHVLEWFTEQKGQFYCT